MNQQLLRKHLFSTAFALAACTGTAVAQWTPVGGVGIVPGGGNNSTHLFTSASDTLYVSFSTPQGHVMKYNGSTWAPVGGAAITTGPANESWSDMAPNGNIYFSYADGTDSSQASVMMYNGSTWSSIGSNLSAGAASATNIVVSSTGVPYLSYIDAVGGNALYVKKYSGGVWSLVGTAAVANGGASYPTLALNSSDEPYVAYSDAGASQNITMKKFDGTAWVNVGSSFCAQPFGGAHFLSMAFDQNDVPYVGYMAPYPAGPSACVSKYDGTAWVTVGAPSFTGTSALFISIALNNANEPYIAFMDGANSSKTSVKKYNGTAWVDVGTPGFSATTAPYTSLRLDSYGNPYVAYMESTNGGTTVMKFPTCTPPTLAAVSATATIICKGDSVTLTATGTLNDATAWQWTAGSCNSTAIGSGASIKVGPGDTTTYYVRGMGGCVSHGPCAPITVNVDSVAKPVVTAAGSVLSSSASAGNQWYKSNTALSGATGQTYTVTSSGWYKVKVTNANNCSAFSDSVFVTAAGIGTISTTADVQIYPSPFAETLHIRFGSNAAQWQQASLTLADNTGRIVLEKKGLEQDNEFHLQHLASGIYFVQLNANGNRQVFRIVRR